MSEKKLQPWICPYKFEGTNEEALFIAEAWAKAAMIALDEVRETLLTQDTAGINAAVLKIQTAAWEKTGFSNLALEMLRRDVVPVSDPGLAVENIVFAIHFLTDQDGLIDSIDALKEHADPRLGWCVWLVHAKPEAWDFYDWRNTHARISIDNSQIPKVGSAPTEDARADEPFDETAKRMLRKCTKGQRQAFHTLSLLAEVRMQDIRTFVEVRTNPLIVGLSGSGKTHVCRLFGKLLGIPTFEATVGGWHLRGGTNPSEATVGKIMQILETGPAVIIIDEVDKIRQTSPDNANYFKGIFDEILALLDCRTDLFGGSETAKANLKKSWILAAGAFQDLYLKKLNGRPMVAEEVEELPPLTYDDITASGWLPDELLNRISAEFVEVRPPTLEEQLALMKAVEERIGVEMPDEKREEEARSAITRMQAMRGLQSHALRAAKARVLIDREEDRKKTL